MSLMGLTQLAGGLSTAADYAGKLGGMTSSFLANPLVRSASMAANVVLPNQPIEPQTMIDLWSRGSIDRATLANWLLAHGISAPATAGGDAMQLSWQRTIDDLRPRPDLPLIKEWFLRSSTPSNIWASAGQLSSGWENRFVLDYLRTETLVDPMQAVRLYHLGYISPGRLTELMRAGNIQSAEQQQILRDNSEPFNPADVFTLWNRGVLSEEMATRHLKAAGYRDPNLAAQIAKLRYYLPGVSDMIRFSVREVWRPDVVARYQYDAEFPPEYAYWARRIGLSYDVKGQFPDAPGGNVPPWEVAYWRAHWETLSPTQSYIALHRIRPDNISQWQEQFPGIQAFTMDDARRMLGISDYAPGVRDWLLASSYRVLTRVDIRRMVRLGTMQGPAVVSAYRDLGYTQSDAIKLAEFAQVEADRARLGKGRERIRRQLATAWQYGLLCDDDYLRQSYPLTLERHSQVVEYQAKSTAQQLEQVNADPAFMAEWYSLRTTRELQLLKETIRAIRRAFLSAELDGLQVAEALQNAGVCAESAQRYLLSWNLQLMTKHRQLTTQQILKAYDSGVITPEEASERLARLRYDTTDINYLIRMTREKRALASARADIAAARTAPEMMEARARELSALQRSTARAERELLKGSTPANLRKWLKKNLIDPLTVRRRLETLGWSGDDAQRLIDEVQGNAVPG